MKSLDKNISDQDRITSFMVVQSMQGRMTAAALNNGVALSTTIGLDDKGVPYFGYAVKYNGENRVIFSGQARSAKEPHFDFVMKLLTGEIVSEICPPAIREVTQAENVEVVSYWKRSLTFEHDVTMVDHDDRESSADPLEKVRRVAAWVGYNSKAEEIIRVSEGTYNHGYDNIERVQYVDMGPRGVVVAMIYKDSKFKPGQDNALGDAIKETEIQRATSATSMMSEASSAMTTGTVSFNERYADTGLSSVSSTPMSLSRLDEVAAEILEATSGTGAVEELMYGGLRIVLPKILKEEEFDALNSEAKNQYLSHVDAIVKLTMVQNFAVEKESPDIYQKFLVVLKRFVESGVFLSVWKKNYIAKVTEFQNLRTLPYYTARSIGMSDATFERLGLTQKFLTLEEVKILRPDLKNLGPRGSTDTPATIEAQAFAVLPYAQGLPVVLSKEQYDALGPQGQRLYYESIQKVVNEASAIWFGSAGGQVSQEQLTFLQNALHSDVFSDGWAEFIQKATPDMRYSKTYYAAQALGLTDDFLERLIGQYTKFEPEAIQAETSNMQAGLEAHREKMSQGSGDLDVSSSYVPPIKAQDVKNAKPVTPAKAPVRKPRAANGVKSTVAKKPAAKKAEGTTAKAPAKRAASTMAKK